MDALEYETETDLLCHEAIQQELSVSIEEWKEKYRFFRHYRSRYPWWEKTWWLSVRSSLTTLFNITAAHSHTQPHATFPLYLFSEHLLPTNLFQLYFKPYFTYLVYCLSSFTLISGSWGQGLRSVLFTGVSLPQQVLIKCLLNEWRQKWNLMVSATETIESGFSFLTLKATDYHKRALGWGQEAEALSAAPELMSSKTNCQFRQAIFLS